MFSPFSVDFKTFFAVQFTAEFYVLTAHAVIISLHLFFHHDSAHFRNYLLLATLIFSVMSLIMIVASQHGIISLSEEDTSGSFFTYLGIVFGVQQPIVFYRQSIVANFGTETRLIATVYSLSTLFSVVVLIVGVSSYFAQMYSRIDQLYSMGKIFHWGTTILQILPLMVQIARMLSYRGLIPTNETTKAFHNRLYLMGLYFLMILACEIHAVVLSFYPPKNWKDMTGMLCGSFVIGAVYYTLSPVGAAFLPESRYD
ncbi:hypothetical protein BGW37DRAFT_473766, partial [Umbelopsis sp. PMI_123]